MVVVTPPGTALAPVRIAAKGWIDSGKYMFAADTVSKDPLMTSWDLFKGSPVLSVESLFARVEGETTTTPSSGSSSSSSSTSLSGYVGGM